MSMKDKMDEVFVVYSITRMDILREIATMYGIDCDDLSLAIFNKMMKVTGAEMIDLAGHISCHLDMDLSELLEKYEGESIKEIVYAVKEYAKEKKNE